MGRLEIIDADLGAGDVCRDREHRGPAAMAVEEPVDQMQVAGSATSGTDGQSTGQLRLRARRECRGLFVPDVDPVDLAAFDAGNR